MTSDQHEELSAEETAFRWFADAHPHEAFIAYPERFIAYVQKKIPGISRGQIIENLRATADDHPTGECALLFHICDPNAKCRVTIVDDTAQGNGGSG